VGSVLLMRLDTAHPFAHFQGYQGATVCVSCHREEGLSWALTHHSTAYRTLARRDREKDSACVGCHVTGMNAGGFDLADDRSSPFIDVTCESCHGPSGPHDGVRTDATTACVAVTTPTTRWPSISRGHSRTSITTPRTSSTRRSSRRG